MRRDMTAGLSALAVWLASGAGLVADLYVAPGGSGDGSGWGSPMGSVQGAIDAWTTGTIYLRYGAWSNASPLVVSNKNGIVLSGGWAGTGGNPGDPTNLPSRLSRDGSATNRILSGYGSTMTLDGVTISDGLRYSPGSGLSEFGGGLYMTNCTLTLTNCVVANNRVQDSGVDNSPAVCGGGLYLVDCVTRIADCTFTNNRAYTTLTGYGGGAGGAIYALNGRLGVAGTLFRANVVDNERYSSDPWGSGGAIRCQNADVQVSNSTFRANYVKSGYTTSRGNARGGAVWASSGSLFLGNSTFETNWCLASGAGDGSRDAMGGAVYAINLATGRVESCVFTGSSIANGHLRLGGTLYLSGKLLVNRCAIQGNGQTNTIPGDVYVASGTLAMTNTLVAANWGHGLVLAAGTATVANCSLADNTGWGLTNAAGAVTLKNAIVWGNAAGGLANASTTTWSDVQGGVLAGEGNLSADPLFVGGGDYHERSKGGSWHGGGWASDPATSPCIDAGDLADPRGALEPAPNRGNRLNMGAYGGTEQASKSAPGPGSVLVVM